MEHSLWYRQGRGVGLAALARISLTGLDLVAWPTTEIVLADVFGKAAWGCGAGAYIWYDFMR